MKTSQILLLLIGFFSVLVIGCNDFITPFPTCDEECMRLLEISEKVKSVCEGIGVADAVPYNSEETRLHPVIILSSSGDLHNWQFSLPKEWHPSSVNDVELVLCVGEEESYTIETCNYEKNITVLREKYRINLRLLEARTAKEVGKRELNGTPPKSCPPKIWGKPNTSATWYGSHVEYQQVENFLREYVSPEN